MLIANSVIVGELGQPLRIAMGIAFIYVIIAVGYALYALYQWLAGAAMQRLYRDVQVYEERRPGDVVLRYHPTTACWRGSPRQSMWRSYPRTTRENCSVGCCVIT